MSTPYPEQTMDYPTPIANKPPISNPKPVADKPPVTIANPVPARPLTPSPTKSGFIMPKLDKNKIPNTHFELPKSFVEKMPDTSLASGRTRRVPDRLQVSHKNKKY